MDAPVSATGISVVSQPTNAVVEQYHLRSRPPRTPQKTWSAPARTQEQSQPSASSPNPRKRDKFLHVSQWFSNRQSLPPGNDDQTDIAQEGVFWPRDLLKQDFPTARIMTFGYNTRVTQGYKPTNQSNIFSHARNLLYELESKRRSVPDRHLIFIVHSLGGIITKEALRRSEIDPDPRIKKIFNSTKAIFFFGTPHRGSKDWASFGEGITKVAGVLLGIDTNDQILHALLPTAPDLEICRESFITQWMQHIDSLTVRTFQESKPLTGVRWGNFNKLVVPPESSSLDHPNQRPVTIDADHMKMVKFSGRDDKVYELVRVDIDELISNAERELQANHTELMNPSKHLERMLAKRGRFEALSYIDEDLLPNLNEESIEWFTLSPQYLEWVSSKSLTFLWLYGLRNSGKTIIAAWLRRQLLKPEATLKGQDVVSIFCLRGIHEHGIMLSIVSQLSSRIDRIELRQDKTALLQFLTKFKHEDELLLDLWGLIEVLIKMFPRRDVVFIIDGIDEAEKIFRTQFLRALQGLAESIKEGITVRIFVSSRDYPDIRDCLVDWPKIEKLKEWKECLDSLYFEEWNARENKISNAVEAGSWLSFSEDYKEWFASPRSELLWLAGKPGSGKSTLMKYIVKKLLEEKAITENLATSGYPIIRQDSTFSNSTAYSNGSGYSGYSISSKGYISPETSATHEVKIVSSFYYSFRGGYSESNHELMLRSIAYQIFQSNDRLFPLIQAQFRRLQADKSKWDYESIKSALKKLHDTKFNIKVFLFVDGMDESDNAHRDDVIQFLISLGRSSHSRCIFKVLIASRPESYIRQWMRQVRHISLEEKNRGDIETIVDSRLSELRQFRLSLLDHYGTIKELEDEEKTFTIAKAYIVDNSCGVFLWVSLVLSELENFVRLGGYSLHDIEECLHNLPTELEKPDGFYALMIQRLVKNIGKAKHLEARSWRTFAWITFSARQLTVVELADALAISAQCLVQAPGTTFDLAKWRPMDLVHSLYTLCGGFVEVKPSGDEPVVQLMHQTVREFLLRKDQLAKPYDMNESSGDKEIAITCCRYIYLAFLAAITQCPVDSTFSLATEVAKHLSDWTLLGYALTYVQLHLDSSGITHSQMLSESQRLISGILKDPTSYASVLLLGWAHRQPWLQYTSTLTEADLTQDCLDRVLVCASGGNRSNVIIAMIYLGAHPTRALYTAALNGQRESVFILLKSGAKVEAWGEQGSTALHAASYLGRRSIVTLLLDHGADPNIMDDARATSLHAASQAGHEGIAQDLIDGGADVNSLDFNGISPLHIAVQAGNEDLTRLLLDSGANPNTRDQDGDTPLHIAIGKGCEELVRLFLHYVTDFDTVDRHGKTAFQLASKNGHEAIVKLLTEAGAQVPRWRQAS